MSGPRSVPLAGNPELNRLLSMKKLAERLGVSEDALRKRYAKLGIPYFVVGRLIRFDSKDVETWLLERRIAPPPMKLVDAAGQRSS